MLISVLTESGFTSGSLWRSTN